MTRHAYTRQTLQAEADLWVERLTARGYKFPDAPVTIYTNGRQHDAAVGMPRGFSTREPSYVLRTRPDEYWDEVKRWQRTSIPARTKKGALPVVYIRLHFHRGPFGDRLETELPWTLIHQLLHLVTPRLPNWKAHLLADELGSNRGWTSSPTGTERMISKALSRAHFAWLQADSWKTDDGWPEQPYVRPSRPADAKGPARRTAPSRALGVRVDTQAARDAHAAATLISSTPLVRVD